MDAWPNAVERSSLFLGLLSPHCYPADSIWRHRNTHYSGEWAVLGLTGLLDWVAQNPDSPEEAPRPPPAEAEAGTRPLRRRRLVHGVTHHWYIE